MNPAPGMEKILVVDDNPENVWPLVEYLEKEYEVLMATSGKKALDIASSENKPDLILLDIMMPDMDGYEVLFRLKGNVSTKEIPVIFITGKTEEKEEAKGIELGAHDFISKPFSLLVVGARVKSILNLKKEMHRRLLLKSQLKDLNLQLENQIQQKMKELEEARKTLQDYEEKYSYLFTRKHVGKNTKTLLIVDDNPDNINILIESLEAHYEIFYANSGAKALEIAFSYNQPDLILLDIMMPGMDGFEVCSRLKASADTWDIPVIFITALGQDIDETKGLNLGGVDFITKPFSIPVVEARIKAALRLKEEMENRMILTRKLEELNRSLEQRVKEKAFELEKAHENLKESEKKFRNLYEHALEGIFQSTPEGQFLSASPAMVEILGYDSEMDLISTITNIGKELYVNPIEREFHKKTLQETGEIHNFETQHRKKNGDIIWVMISARVITDDNGENEYYQGFLIDITERKNAESEIQHRYLELALLNRIIAASVSEMENEAVLDVACRELTELFQLPFSSAHLITSEKSEVIKTLECVNPEFNGNHELLSFDKDILLPENPIGRKLAEHKRPLMFNDAPDEILSESLKDYFINQKGGSILFIPLVSEEIVKGCMVLHSLEPDKFTDEDIELCNSVAQQLTGVLHRNHLLKSQEQLQTQYFQSQKMEAIGQLTGGVAHDFNNILTVIIGVAELLDLEIGPENSLHESVEQIRSSAFRASDLVRQLLAFSRQQVLQPRILSLNDILSNMNKMLQRLIGENMELKTIFDSELGHVKADQGQIEQVLMNLLVNARDAMTQSGNITIETDNVYLHDEDIYDQMDIKAGPYVMLTVSDTGKGMDEETRARIFEPFYTTKPKGHGTGLGLATVHGIVHQSGGHIKVYSEVNKGTTFKVYLPRTDVPKEPVEQKELSGESYRGSETILVIEDEKIVRDIVYQTLSRFGYEVLQADCGEAALKLFAAQKDSIDLLISDIILPGNITGIQLSNDLTAAFPQLKVLFMSGYTEKHIHNYGTLDPEVAFIQKPFHPVDLTRKVRQTLDSPQAKIKI